jgi:hypothetical protein
MSEESDDWDHHDPKKWIAQGYIDLDDDVAFKLETGAASCFGKALRRPSAWLDSASNRV